MLPQESDEDEFSGPIEFHVSDSHFPPECTLVLTLAVCEDLPVRGPPARVHVVLLPGQRSASRPGLHRLRRAGMCRPQRTARTSEANESVPC